MSRKEPLHEEVTRVEKMSELLSQDLEPLWTVEDVARHLRLEPETVRAKARAGDLPAIKMGRVWRFRRDLIRKWLQQEAERTIEATSSE